MNVSAEPKAPLEPPTRRRNFPLTAATPSTPATPSIPSVTHRFTPVPTPAHGSPRAIRVRRSPR
jgi:hypothetical protein